MAEVSATALPPGCTFEWTGSAYQEVRVGGQTAIILGLLPLVFANGASMIARRDIATPVFVGMTAASTLGIFLIPMLYVTFQTLRERMKHRFGKRNPAHGVDANA
ncbi:Efflux pump membrane transporter BepG [Blastochloris viridis]|nr:Efflux pump membrane transporter BepG [Blastochloris viridis]CUU43246.1 Efflux pump membrane transporter BepG [Blastochloris viridis]